ncbi:hypothetical protein ACOMHN_023603 [Nucella lapillus]
MDHMEDEFCNNSLTDIVNRTLERNKHTEQGTALKPEAIAVPLTFAVIFLVGVTGNILLTLNFARHKKLSTPHNALVVNLAAGDLLMLFVGVPFNSVWYTFAFWKFGDFLCRLSRFAETLATGVTIATLTLLSVERFYIVTGRRRHHQLSSMPTKVIIIIWVAGFILALPDFISPRVLTPPNNATNTTGSADGGESPEFCLDFNPDWSKYYPKANIMFKFLFYFCIPLLIIAPFYILLAIHLLYKMFGSRRTPTVRTPLNSTTPAQIRGTDEDDDEREGEMDQKTESSHNDTNSSQAVSNNVNSGRGGRKAPARKRQRLAVTVLGLVVGFVLCWLPRHVYLLWFHFNPEPFNAFWHVFKITGFCLMFSNSAVNPFVFYVLDLHFRAFVNSALLCRLPRNNNSHGRREGENGAANAETMAVDMTVTDADRKTCIVMNQLPPCADRVDAV